MMISAKEGSDFCVYVLTRLTLMMSFRYYCDWGMVRAVRNSIRRERCGTGVVAFGFWSDDVDL
jgi:hypothetical protein